MAEIKTTMALVMEKAARMGIASGREIQEEKARENGMRLAGRFLDSGSESLVEVLNRQPPELQMVIRKGMVDTLLRNILLPREKHLQKRIKKAIKGVIELGGEAGDIVSICRDIEHITGQYHQHRSQLRQQLEEQIRMQYEQLLSRQTGAAAGDLKVDPTRQPKFQEEWARVETELDGQYHQALDQHKQLLKQRLA